MARKRKAAPGPDPGLPPALPQPGAPGPEAAVAPAPTASPPPKPPSPLGGGQPGPGAAAAELVESGGRVYVRAPGDAGPPVPGPEVPPGPPVPPSPAAAPVPGVPRPQLSDLARVQLLHAGLAEVVNRQRPSSAVLIAALELMKHQALRPLVLRLELEGGG